MSGPLKKSSIEIQRSKIENFLMNVKEFVQKNNRKVFTGFLFIIIFLTLSLSAYIFYNRSAEKALVKFEVILEKYKSDPSKPEIMENTITELHKLISETRFGFINELCYYYLANILFDNNKFNDAYDAFSKFIKKSSSKDVFVPIAVNKSALCLEEMGKLDEAIDLLNRFDEKNTDTIVSDQVNYNIGRLYSLKNNQIKAREYFSNVIAKYPKSVFAERSKERIFLLSAVK